MADSFKNTIAVNLFAGPGAGKSTGAAYIFARLKMLGVDAELVTEFAKDMVWEENQTVISNQLYVFGTQSFRMSRCRGKVRVIITDSPLLLNGLYCKPTEPYYDLLQQVVYAEWSKYDNYNYFIRRVKPYNPNGRFQNEEGAKAIDKITLKCLANNKVKYTVIDGSQDGYDTVVEQIYHAVCSEGGRG